MSSEGRFQIDITAKSKALSLQVRFIAAFWTSPVSHARRVTGSINARVFSLILHVSLTLLQVLGVSSSIASDPTLTRRQSSKVRYSLQVRLRNLWFRIRGKHKESNHTNHVKKTAKSSSQLTKSKSKRILVAVGRFWRKNKSFEKKTGSQKAVVNHGDMTQSQEALGRDTVAMALNGVGVVSTLITLVQLAVTRGLPVLITGVTGLAVVSRLVFLNRCSTISPQFSKLWKEAMQIGGFSLMPQAMQAIFRPYLSDFGFIPNGTYTGTFALIMILLARYRRLPTKATRFFEVLSAGVPAVLVLWAPIVQLWTSCWSPANADLVQICTGLLAILSNCASLPLTQSKHQTLWTF
ncbi:maltose excess protein 1-like, chloroplastic isoform X2 [Physcomitrium patens]|uniref:Uncharacterized protein n=1 Tax=Physcomitrium patens TaxID=3218 RepID=A0A2K1IRI8_PHYPA|nr:maltose excess protein 1-like, chloroplastic isoform X1 [Physcomitrium patens]PNR31891.1 hypothetical protein PHYPA_026014 [Physcomitrium patens]|eukprot:XP_024359391.1 maltose excess protein 1-like, chloroplastic isoform X1 [Physcomitrella patens]